MRRLMESGAGNVIVSSITMLTKLIHADALSLDKNKESILHHAVKACDDVEVVKDALSYIKQSCAAGETSM